MQAAVMPHSLPELRDVQEEGSEVFVYNFKDLARVFLEQPVVMRQEWKVHMSHYEFVSRRPRALLAHILSTYSSILPVLYGHALQRKTICA